MELPSSSIVRPPPSPSLPPPGLMRDPVVTAQRDAYEVTRTSRQSKYQAEIDVMKEVVPTLDISVVMEILHGNGYDLDKSIDAALALMASLAAEEGKAVLSDIRSFSDDGVPRGPSRDAVDGSGPGDEAFARKKSPATTPTPIAAAPPSSSSSSSSSLSPSHQQHAAGPMTSSSSSNLSRGSGSSSSSNGSGSSSSSSSSSSAGNVGNVGMPQSGNRGPPVLLSERFLAIPRFRLTVDHHTDAFTDFTVSFRRKHEKLGITIQESDGEIVIHTVHQKSLTEPLLAMEAGIRVGDVLTGINSEYFSPGAEVQDVIDILHLAGMYVTLHFTRRYAPLPGSEGVATPQYHKFAQMLLDQTVISKERAANVSKAVYRLKERVIQWDTGFITERIELWKLDTWMAAGSGRAATTTSSSSAASVGPSSSGSATSLFSSLGNLGTAGSPTHAGGPGAGAPSSGGRRSDVVMCTRNLRPAVSIRLMRAEERQDHVVYVIWVMDVKSGAEWYVRRRFREFYEFRDVSVT